MSGGSRGILPYDFIKLHIKHYHLQYESLRNNATTMKERYEERIEEIETERDNLGEELENVQSQVKSLKAQGTSSPVAVAAGTENLLEEVS